MKRKITLSIALVLSITALLSAFSRTASAQPTAGKIFVADTGVIMLGANQKLRVIVTTANDGQVINFKFRRCNYTIGNDGSLSVLDTQISPFLSVASNQARYFTIELTNHEIAGIRARIGSKNPDIVVTFQIINTMTGEVQSYSNGGISAEDNWETPPA